MSIDPIAIGRSALDVEWQRMQAIAQNLANENTGAIPGGGTYRPVHLVSGPAGDFTRIVSEGARVGEPNGVRVFGIEPENLGVRRVYDPSLPGADSSGFVTYPNIDHAKEMTLLVQTARSYESDLTVLALALKMSMRALNIGKR